MKLITLEYDICNAIIYTLYLTIYSWAQNHKTNQILWFYVVNQDPTCILGPFRMFSRFKWFVCISLPIVLTRVIHIRSLSWFLFQMAVALCYYRFIYLLVLEMPYKLDGLIIIWNHGCLPVYMRDVLEGWINMRYHIVCAFSWESPYKEIQIFSHVFG